MIRLAGDDPGLDDHNTVLRNSSGRYTWAASQVRGHTLNVLVLISYCRTAWRTNNTGRCHCSAHPSGDEGLLLMCMARSYKHILVVILTSILLYMHIAVARSRFAVTRAPQAMILTRGALLGALLESMKLSRCSHGSMLAVQAVRHLCSTSGRCSSSNSSGASALAATSSAGSVGGPATPWLTRLSSRAVVCMEGKDSVQFLQVGRGPADQDSC
jgi:hypothetical protein